MTIRALAVDFTGTIALPGANPDSAAVVAALQALNGVVPEGFPSAFDTVHRQVRRADRAGNTHTPFAEEIRQAAAVCGAVVPDPAAVADAVLSALPDGAVDPRAARVLRRLRAGGLRCVLASNTQKPEPVRWRTLTEAGIADCFDALVLSSTLGVRKPHPDFYAAVADACRLPARHILFVGDNPAKDAAGPRAFGMQAVLITRLGERKLTDEATGATRHFNELPAFLSACGTGPANAAAAHPA